MAYKLKINETFSVYRSRNTGAICLWERNPIYGYDGLIDSLPQGAELTVRQLIAWSEKAGERPATVLKDYVAMIREGCAGMLPNPTFDLNINV